MPWVMLAGSVALSVYAIVTIWREEELRTPVKVLWSAISLVLIPYIGSILWFGFRIFGMHRDDE